MTQLRDRVAAHVADKWPGAELRSFEPLPGGHSGITCLATIAGGPVERVVVKATPPGRKAVGRHDVLRQARILSTLTAAGTVPVPEVLFQDSGGEPYFVMRWHPGESVEPVLDPASHLTARLIELRSLSAVRALAALHRVPVNTLGEPAYSPRQELERWMPTMRTLDPELRSGSETVETALLDLAPEPARPAIVHGDFRLGNTLCTGGTVNAVIDWEIWSLGDPRVDLAWMVLFCEPANFPGIGDADCPMPPADALRTAYEQAAGIALERYEWFEAMARYKMAAIMGNNLARHRGGRHHDPFQEGLIPTIRRLIAGAAQVLAP